LCGGGVWGQGSLDSSDNVVIGDMKKQGTWGWLVGTDERVRCSIVFEEGEDVGWHCLDQAAGVGYGMMGNDLAALAGFLVVNMELDEVR